MDFDSTMPGSVEPTIERAVFPFVIQQISEEEDRLRIRGVMHSFGKTNSRRILHPNGFKNFLQRNPGARLPMLAQHGMIEAGFATIGEWDQIEYREGVGAVWSGWIGKGTPLQAEARSLA